MACNNLFWKVVAISSIILLYAVSFAALIIGVIKKDQCSGNPRLPVILIVFGCVGIGFGIYFIIHMLSNKSGGYASKYSDMICTFLDRLREAFGSEIYYYKLYTDRYARYFCHNLVYCGIVTIILEY